MLRPGAPADDLFGIHVALPALSQGSSLILGVYARSAKRPARLIGFFPMIAA
jgi:hypothetical protein